jgi:hypothetical protein
MCELRHVVGLVELGWVDFVDGVTVHLLLAAIVALDQKPALGQVFYNPTAHEGGRWIAEPHIALAREVVLALDDAAQHRGLLSLLRYELRGKCAGRRAVSNRVRAHACRVAAAQQRAAQLCEGLVPEVAHLGFGLSERRRDEARLGASRRGWARCSSRKRAVAGVAPRKGSIGSRCAHDRNSEGGATVCYTKASATCIMRRRPTRENSWSAGAECRSGLCTGLDGAASK